MMHVRRACVFAHFDRDGHVDEYVRYYLSCLLTVTDHIHFVTVCKLNAESYQALVSQGIEVTQRDNVGYDFVSYSVGLKTLEIAAYDEIIICNDSVYGPFFELDSVFRYMKNVDCDFWGITESLEISRHIQSYFVVFRATVLSDDVFRRFWSDVQVLADKNAIIAEYEIGMSQQFLESGFCASSYVSNSRGSMLRRAFQSLPQFLRRYRLRWKERGFYTHLLGILFRGDTPQLNPTQFEWKTLLVKHRSPFLKIELLRENPLQIAQIDQAIDLIKAETDYPSDLILGHLARIKPGSINRGQF